MGASHLNRQPGSAMYPAKVGFPCETDQLWLVGRPQCNKRITSPAEKMTYRGALYSYKLGYNPYKAHQNGYAGLRFYCLLAYALLFNNS